MRLKGSQVGELVVHGFGAGGLGGVATALQPFRRRDSAGSQCRLPGIRRRRDVGAASCRRALPPARPSCPSAVCELPTPISASDRHAQECP